MLHQVCVELMLLIFRVQQKLMLLVFRAQQHTLRYNLLCWPFPHKYLFEISSIHSVHNFLPSLGIKLFYIKVPLVSGKWQMVHRYFSVFKLPGLLQSTKIAQRIYICALTDLDSYISLFGGQFVEFKTTSYIPT